jgi:hypothetical protein
MQRFLDYLIFLSLLLLVLIALLGKVLSGNLWVMGIFCVAVVRLVFVIAAKIDEYRNSRRIRLGIAAYLKGMADGDRKDNQSGLHHRLRKTIHWSVD